MNMRDEFLGLIFIRKSRVSRYGSKNKNKKTTNVYNHINTPNLQNNKTEQNKISTNQYTNNG